MSNDELEKIVNEYTEKGNAEDIHFFQKKLRNKMSEISEKMWAAGWMHDCEFKIWAEMQDPNVRFGPFGANIGKEDIRELKKLCMIAEGWIIWDSPMRNEKFVSLQEWLQIFRRYEKGNRMWPPIRPETL